MSASAPARAARRRQPRVSEHLFVVLVAVACGLAGAAGAILFRSLIHFFAALFLGSEAGPPGSLLHAWHAAVELHRPEPRTLGGQLAWWGRLLAPAAGGAIVGPLVHYLAREARGDGVPEVMQAIAVRGGVIRARVVAVKTLASALTLGSGGSAGREAPIVQIGAGLGSTLGQALRLPARQLRTLVACGSAAGIAAIFNAPIAGALFAVEVILADFAAAQLAPIVIASVVATVVSRLFLGDHPAFLVPAYQLVSPWELVPYAVCGVLAGLVGVAFTATILRVEAGFHALRLPAAVKPALGGLMVGAIGIWIPNVFGGSYGTVASALEGQLALTALPLLLVAKMFATSITLGSGGSGGIFAPSLVLGSVLGGLVGAIVHQWFPASTGTSGAYALVTMGAVLAATTHAPITAIILVFELTQSIAIVPPLMAACVIGTISATWLRRESIYTLKLRQLGVDLLAEQDPNVLRQLSVRDVIDREPERVPAGAPFRAVLDLVVRSRHSEFFVVDERGALLGAISVEALRRLLFEQEALQHVVVAADLVEAARPVVTEDSDLDAALQLLANLDAEEIAVVDARDASRLVGSVHERDVLEAYHGEMLRRDLAGGVGSRIDLAAGGREVDLGGGFVLVELDAPRHFVGHTLRELDARARTGIQVVLLRSRVDGKQRVRVPTPDDRLEAGDVLVISGPADAVRRLASARAAYNT